MPQARPTLRERISYRVDYLMSLNPAFKMLGLFAVTSALIVAGGVLYGSLGNPEAGMLGGLWAALNFIADAGNMSGEETVSARTVALFATVGGMLIFALLLGLVTETLGEKVDDLRKGRSRVIEEGHTLVLGWNEKVFTVVEQLVEANANLRRGVVVILSAEPKERMEEEIRESIADLKSTVVVCRSGNTTMASDLYKVGAAQARSIIVLGDDKAAEESDIRATKTVLALQRAVGNLRGHVVVELMDGENRHMVEMVGAGGVEVVAAREVIGRLMVQTARQNGLAQTYAALLGFDGSEFYARAFPQCDGKRFGEIWPHLPDAVVCGVIQPPKGKEQPRPKVLLNPPEDLVLRPADQLLVLAEDDDTFSFAPKPAAFKTGTLPAWRPPAKTKENLLFLGWRADLGGMIRELDGYVAPGSQLTLVSNLSRDEANERLKQEGVTGLANLKLAYCRGNLAQRKDLEALHVEQFSSVLVLADETGRGRSPGERERAELTPDEVDARTLMSLLLIRDIQKKNGVTGVPVLSEIRDPRTKELAAIAEASDYVVSNEITSMLMTQISENRALNAVWDDLFSAEGSEIYLKDARRYVAAGEKASFFDLYARARSRGEVLLGWRKAADHDAEYGGVVINPADKTTPAPWGEGDRLVVLAEDDES